MTRLRLYHFKFLLITFYFIETRTMMIRNDALISKMVSDFQKDNTLAIEATYRPPEIDQQQPKNVLLLMQSVLCKNFPTIPCGMIVKDPTLKTLIERSIQQLKHTKQTMDLQKTTTAPGYLTMFPIINSEDISNFLQVSETGYYSNTNGVNEQVKERKHGKKRRSKSNNEEKGSKNQGSVNVDNTRSTVYGPHKNIRKFYPHKIKYKDKSAKGRDNYRDYSDEKLSMSVEDPENNTRKKKMTENYNVEPENAPVWRIDYMKHGEPSLNMFSYEPDRLNEKLVKTNVVKNIMEQTPRKDVLHPDVYIKKNYVRRNGLEMNSGGID